MLRLGLAVCAVAVVAGTATAAADVRIAPTLRLVDPSPATIRGHGFKARERVRVTLVANAQTRRKIVYASRTGTFTAAFASVDVSRPCNLQAFASGSRGSRAAMKITDMMCPPPIAP